MSVSFSLKLSCSVISFLARLRKSSSKSLSMTACLYGVELLCACFRRSTLSAVSRLGWNGNGASAVFCRFVAGASADMAAMSLLSATCPLECQALYGCAEPSVS